MYSEQQIAALNFERFDFSDFDWEAARERLANSDGITDVGDTRALHVAYTIAKNRHGIAKAAERGVVREERPVVGLRGPEHPNSHQPLTVVRIKYAVADHKLSARPRQLEQAAA